MQGFEKDSHAEELSEVVVRTVAIISGVISVLLGCALTALLVHQSELPLIIYKLKDKIRAQANLIKQLLHKLVKKDALLENAANQIVQSQDQEWTSKDIEGKKCSQTETGDQEPHINTQRSTLGSTDKTRKPQVGIKNETRREEGPDQSELLASHTEIGPVVNTNSLESSKTKLHSTQKTCPNIVPMENSLPIKNALEKSSKSKVQTKVTSRFETNSWIRWIIFFLLQSASCASTTGLSKTWYTNDKHCYRIHEIALGFHKGLVPCDNALLCLDFYHPFCPLPETNPQDHYSTCYHVENTETAMCPPIVYFKMFTMELMPSLKASVGPSSKDQSCMDDGGSEQNKGNTGSGSTEKGSRGCGSNSQQTPSNFYGTSHNSGFRTGPGGDGDDEPPNRRPSNGNSGHYLDEGDSTEGKKHRKKMHRKTSPSSKDQPAHLQPVETPCPYNSSRTTEFLTPTPQFDDSQDVPSTSQGHLQNSSHATLPTIHPSIQHPAPTQEQRSLSPYNHNPRALQHPQNVRKVSLQEEREQEERSNDDSEVDSQSAHIQPVETLFPLNSSRTTEFETPTPPFGDSQDVPSTSQDHLQNSTNASLPTIYPSIQHPTPNQEQRSLPPYNHNSRAWQHPQNVRKAPLQPEGEQGERLNDDSEVDQGVPLYRQPGIGSILPFLNSRSPGKGQEQNGINDGERLPYSNVFDDQEKRRTKWWDPGKDRNGSLPHGQEYHQSRDGRTDYGQVPSLNQTEEDPFKPWSLSLDSTLDGTASFTETSDTDEGLMRQFAGSGAEIVVNPQPPTDNLTETCTDPASGVMFMMDRVPTGNMILDAPLSSHDTGSTSQHLAALEEDIITPQPPTADIMDEGSFDEYNRSEAEPRAILQHPTGNLSEDIVSLVPPTSDVETTHDSSGEIQFPFSLKRKSKNKYDSNLLRDRHIRRLQPHLGRTFNGSGHSQLHLNSSRRTDRVFSHPPGDYGLTFCWLVRERLIRPIQPRLDRAFNGSVHTSLNRSADLFPDQPERSSGRNDSSWIDRVWNDSNRVNRVFSHPPGHYGLASRFVEERCIRPPQPHLTRAFDGSEHSRHLLNNSSSVGRVFYHPPGNYGVSVWWPVWERLVRPMQPCLDRAFGDTPLNGHSSKGFLNRPERNAPRSDSSRIGRVFSTGVHAARNDSTRANRVFYHPPGYYGLALWTMPRDDLFFVHLQLLIIFLSCHQHHFGS